MCYFSIQRSSLSEYICQSNSNQNGKHLEFVPDNEFDTNNGNNSGIKPTRLQTSTGTSCTRVCFVWCLVFSVSKLGIVHFARNRIQLGITLHLICTKLKTSLTINYLLLFPMLIGKNNPQTYAGLPLKRHL